MAFKDFKEFTTPLILPILGKEYVIPEVSAALGAKLMLAVERAQEVMAVINENEEAAAEAKAKGEEPPEPKPVPDFAYDEDDEEEELYREILGPEVIAQMEADGAPYSAIKLAGLTGYHKFLYGLEAAEAFWNSGGDPKALAENLTGITSTDSTTNTDEATTTKKRDSTNGTKSRKK